MQPVSHTTTTLTKDVQTFESTAPDGSIETLTLTATTREAKVRKPTRDGHPVKSKIETKTSRQVHRRAPYPGARRVRVSASSTTIITVEESIAARSI
ncbi:hypothetical protein AURDEDRAFT_178194 [Auricularia subglabra TFB-10046 SS5]|uniref:Uncharacterized protein n=1 Tax=Auricularia subglabra (strain TFB-10046 / SS5) TaxID=717982 RepID=J0WK83_AURST|nr:hypothetical protein AURDEDRAFT_178194 [Auricularia subglabra TFB-10046 SS5]